MKIAAAADIHAGRIPALTADTSPTSRFTLDLLADYVVGQEYDVLLLCGDVMDSEKTWWSCYGPLVDTLKRLRDNGVRVIAIAGNHDVNVFPRLAKEHPGLITVLGSRKWEKTDIDGVRFIARGYTADNPLESLPQDFTDTPMPVIALMHCSVDSSDYCPVSSCALESSEVDFFALGHIHKFNSGRNWSYCTSPYPLDRAEEGQHGILEIKTEGKEVSAVFRQVADLFYSPVEYTCSEESGVSGIMYYLQKRKESIVSLYPDVSAVRFNLLLSGTGTEDIGTLNENEEISDLRDFRSPVPDLSALSKREGPVGILAREMLNPDSALHLEIREKITGGLGNAFNPISLKDREDAIEDAYKQACLIILRDFLKQEGM